MTSNMNNNAKGVGMAPTFSRGWVGLGLFMLNQKTEDKSMRKFIQRKYIRSTSDTPPKWRIYAMRHITPKWSDICHIADIPKLCDICLLEGSKHVF